VSMGMTSALKWKRVVRNTRAVLAIESLTAARALEFLLPSRPVPLGAGPGPCPVRVRCLGRRSRVIGRHCSHREADRGWQADGDRRRGGLAADRRLDRDAHKARYRNVPRGNDNFIAWGYAVLWPRPAGSC